MQKIRFIFILLLPLLSAAETDLGPTFSDMMGGNSYIETPQDLDYYRTFESLYKNFQCGESNIPHVLHFVWLGSHGVPAEALKCMRAWAEYHREWEIYFWSDHPHPMPHPCIQRKSIKRFAKQLPANFQVVHNRGDQSFLVRLLILQEFGGVCPDCDVEPKAAVDKLISKNAFLALADPIKSTCLSSSVCADPCFIAAEPGHPIIKGAWKEALAYWSNINVYFPGDDDESFDYRSLYRTRVPLTHAIINHAGEFDSVLPPGFLTKDKAVLRHLKMQFWRDDRIKYEDRVFSHMAKLHRQQDGVEKIVYLLCGSSIFVLGSVLFAFFAYRKTLRKNR